MASRGLAAAAAWCVVASSFGAWAQNAPDAGSILRDIERSTGKNQPAPAPLAPPPGSVPREVELPSRPGETVYVAGFQLNGSRFSAADLQDVLVPFSGRMLSLSDLQEVARRIGGFYRDRNLLAHAFVPPQTIRDGLVEITVVEGKLGRIIIDPAKPSRLDPELAANVVRRRLQEGEVVRPRAVDEAVAVLNDTPGVKASSTLAAGAKEGESDVVVKLEDKPLATGSLIFDNGGSGGTGVYRGLATLSLDDALGLGDRFGATALKTEGTSYLRLTGQALAGSSGLSLGLSASGLRYHVGGKFKDLDLRGTSATGGLNAAYPIRRTDEFSLTASAGVEIKRMVDKAAGIITKDKHITVGTAGLSATTKDEWAGGGTNSFSVQFSAGHVGLGQNQAAQAADAAAAHTEGTYGKVAITASREHSLTKVLTLVPTLQFQAGTRNLDSSEQFGLGGADGIRAYPSGEASGDIGGRATVELRWKALDTLELFGFYDIGFVQQHYHTWASWQSVPGQPNSYALQGGGIGGKWTPLDFLTIRGTIASTVGPNAGHDLFGYDSDGRDRSFRSWIQVVGSF